VLADRFDRTRLGEGRAGGLETGQAGAGLCAGNKLAISGRLAARQSTTSWGRRVASAAVLL
jgi:hypothetical protein